MKFFKKINKLFQFILFQRKQLTSRLSTLRNWKFVIWRRFSTIGKFLFFNKKKTPCSNLWIFLKNNFMLQFSKFPFSRDEECDGCIEKQDFIKRIEELKPKYVRDEL